MHFFHFYLCSSSLFCLKLNFGAFFNNFFNGFEISVKFFLVILALFKNFEAKHAKKRLKKIKKTSLVNVS
jgi:hypothetical protein